MISTASLWVPYCGPAPAAGDWRWNLNPVLLATLAATTLLVGWHARGRERALGFSAVAVLAVVFVSPLCALSSATRRLISIKA